MIIAIVLFRAKVGSTVSVNWKSIAWPSCSFSLLQTLRADSIKARKRMGSAITLGKSAVRNGQLHEA
jgi:hypothetical protein